MNVIIRWGAISIFALTCAGCGFFDKESEAPPRATDKAPMPQQKSLIAVPVDANAASMRQALERAIPRQLWTINQRERACVKPQQVKIFGKALKVTPPISCTIVGQVTRGALRLHGEGDEVVIDVPINAQISARDVGGVLKGETATGSAMAQARVRIELLPDWQTRGKARIKYGWTKAPGIDFLGRRITFTDQANAKLAPVIRNVEREVSREIARLNVRAQAAGAWRQAFTTLQLNRENPPVWMRVTPQRILYGGYRIDGQNLRLNLGLEALTETFVAGRPGNPDPTPLPQWVSDKPGSRLNFFVPVLADYAQLEPVILDALQKRSSRPIELPGIGPVMTKFEKVIAYGTTGNRIAVGITLTATPTRLNSSPTRGRIWLTATPVNNAGSAEVHFKDVIVTGDTDGIGGDLLLLMGNRPSFSALIAAALTQNFSNDVDELQGKIRHAVEHRREGAFTIKTEIVSFEIGEIKAYGNGLYLPVRMNGTASVNFRPGK